MKHLFSTMLLSLAAVSSLWGAPNDGAQRVRRVPTATGDGTTIYGEVTHSYSMDVTTEDGLAWGLYSFNASSPMTVTPLNIHNTLCANGGGTYRKGKVYFTSYYEDFTGQLGYLYFIEMDLADYSIERYALEPDTYDAIAADMTYDPVGDKIYGVSFDPDDVNLTSFILVDYDLSTGYPTKIAPIDRMSAIASDNMGQLWGIRYTDGMLVKIDKLTAQVTEVGATGIIPIYNGSACFDFETGKLYWATNERATEESGLYQIDINSGQASLISMFPDGESISTMYIPRNDDIALLNPVTDITADFTGSNLEGTISFTAPTTAKDGTPLSGDVTVAGYLDGVLNFSIPMAPGESTSRTYTLTQGMHTIELVATHPDVGRSDRASLDFYVGTDGPEAVSNIALEKIDSNKIKISWDTPSRGEHGGNINPALIYYKITRLPDGKMLTDEATGNSFTDVITNTQLRRYSYEITGYYKNVTGATAISDDMEMGEPVALPYSQSFDTMDDYATFVVQDCNKDAERPDEGHWGWDSSVKCAAYKYHTFLNGDDWLITPGLNLTKGKTYSLRFTTKAGRIYPETLEVKIGKGYKSADFSQTLMPRTDLKSPDLQFEEHVITFNVEEDGHYYIGFHAVTEKGQYYLYLDDVSIEEGASMSAPGLVTDLQVLPGEAPTEVKVSFKAPDVDIFGNSLADLSEVKVYRGESLVKTLTAADGLAVGESMSFTDADVPAGFNTYRVVAVNSHGEGNPVEAKVYAGLDLPAAVDEVSQTAVDDNHASISWSPVSVGANGGSLAYEPLSYRITDNNGNFIANVEGTSYTAEVNTADGQKSMIYDVRAVNSKGIGAGAQSDFITYGKAYQDDFAESFTGGQNPTCPGWIMRVINESPYDNGFYGRYFSYSHKPNDKDRGPFPTPQDNDGGMLVAYTDFLDVQARMISPKINVAGLNNPVLSFWFYHYYNPDTENGFSTDKENMDIEVLVDGEYKTLTASPILLINGNGWYRYDLPLKEAVGAKDFQVAFHTHNYISYDMHVDNITVHDTPDHDLVAQSFTLPEQIAVNSTRDAVVTVFNNGMVPAEDFTVELYRNGELVASQEGGEPLAFAKERTFTFPITPSIVDAGKSFEYQARISFADDADLSNNTTETISVNVPTNNLPRVTDLAGTYADGALTLSWSDPDMNASGVVTDGFESYEAFTITDFGEWGLVDNDGSLTYTISNSESASGDYEYPNAGYQMAFQILNPGLAGIKGNLWTPYLGDQMAVCFAAAERDNDDWLISPEVKGGSSVSFMAKTVVDAYGLDRFYFCYSTEDEPDITTFQRLGDVNVVPASEWTRFEFTLPADAKYFAINCVSSNTYALLVDEVSYESANADLLEFRGYNVYLDGVRINDQIVEDNEFVDRNPQIEGEHIYNVTAIFDKGESCLSNDYSFNLSGVNTLAADGMAVKAGRNCIIVTNAGGKEVTISAVNGMVMFRQNIGDYARISLDPGIYMLRAGDRIVKIVVR